MAQMRYASQPDVLRHLKIKETDVETIDRLIRLEHGLADAFEYRTGRCFVDEDVAPITRTVQGYGSNLLVLPVGVWRVDRLLADDAVTGTAWELASDDWMLWGEDAHGAAVGILVNGAGTWYGLSVHITGLWSDQDVPGIPADVREAMTFLTVRQYRRQTASPADQVGPDGFQVPTPHAWDDPMVKAAINRHRVRRRTVGV